MRRSTSVAIAALQVAGHHWPGVNGLTALLARRSLRATRPLHFFRPNGPTPDAVEMTLVVPPELGPEDGTC